MDFLILFDINNNTHDGRNDLSEYSGNGCAGDAHFRKSEQPKIKIGSKMMLMIAPVPWVIMCKRFFLWPGAAVQW